MAKVVKTQVWRAPDGTGVSVFSSYVPPGSVLEETGWDIEGNDGTVGRGKVPFKTKEEAEAWLAKFPNFPGMGALTQ